MSVPGPSQWLVLIVFVPLLAAVAAVLWPGRGAGRWLTVLTGLLTSGGLLSLSARLLDAGEPVTHALGGWPTPLGIALYADGLSLAMLWLTWVVMSAASWHADAYNPAHGIDEALFRPLWLACWCALNAVFVSGDLFNVYVVLEISTLAAVPLVAIAGGRAALTAALRYLLFALLGALVYLLGVALVYGRHGRLDMHGLEITPEPAMLLAAGLVTAGLMAKAALVPMHVWLPPAHSRAPAPVSAILSALVVKAAVYLLLRLWTWTWPELINGAAWVLGGLGAVAMIHGSVLALLQVRLKRVVAYSTVAQLGYLLLVFPLASLLAWQGVVMHAVSHGLAKAGFFLAAGNIMHLLGHDRLQGMRGISGGPLALTMFALALSAVSLMGLPPSGGFLAKWLLLQAALEAGAWGWAALLLIAGLLAAAYLFRVLAILLARDTPDPLAAPGSDRHVPTAMAWSALTLALGSAVLAFAGEPLLRLFSIGSPDIMTGSTGP